MNLNLTHLAAAAIVLTAAPAAAQQTAYGYLFGSRTGENVFVSFDTARPQTFTNVGTRNYSGIHPSAGEYVDGKIYTYRVEFGDFSEIYADGWAVYDGETYKQIQAKDMPRMNRVADMTFDYSTNTMYALVEDAYTTGVLSATSLCAIDMATGDCTLLGSPGELRAIDGYGRETDDALITLACDNSGQLYAMSAYRYLYKLDKHSAQVEQVGERHNLGTAAQFQSMAFDAEGRLWWAQQHPSYGHFCEIDLATAIPGGFVDFKTDYEKLNKLGDDAQVTVLFFKDKTLRKNSLKAVGDFSAAVAAPDVNTVVLSWSAPGQTYEGLAGKPDGYKVYRMGTSGAIATLPADATGYRDADAPNGTTVYEVIPFDAAGDGFPAFCTVFAGYDRLSAVSDMAVSVDERTTTLTWSAPASTVNGGYADYDAITYNVYRGIGDDLIPLVSGIAETSFTETVEGDGTFYYVVEAVSGGVTGEQARSESFVMSSVASVPYFTGFEIGDGSAPWTFINCEDNASKGRGWSIGSSYYVYEGKSVANAATGGTDNLGDDWLYSPAIQFKKGRYVLDYYVNGSSFDKHSYSVHLGTDNKTPMTSDAIYSIDNELEYDENGLNPAGSKGWKHVEVKFDVPEDGTYHLGFHFTTTAIYANLRIDNLSIKEDASSGIDAVCGGGSEVAVSVEGRVARVVAPSAIESVSIVNMQGAVVMAVAGNGAGSMAVDASMLPRGIYIVTVVTADARATHTKVRL